MQLWGLHQCSTRPHPRAEGTRALLINQQPKVFQAPLIISLANNSDDDTFCATRRTVFCRRVPASPACFPWAGGNTSVLEDGFNAATGSAGAVLVSRSGNLDATSAYGYKYSIDFVGPAVRGDMDLRLLIALVATDADENATGVHDVVFDGLGQESSVVVTLPGGLYTGTFIDATVALTYEISCTKLGRRIVVWVCRRCTPGG